MSRRHDAPTAPNEETTVPGSERLVLRPARAATLAWAAAGVLLVAIGVWFVLDSGGAPLAWVAVAVFGAIAAYFLLQAVAPSLFTVVADDDGVRGRNLMHPIDVRWSEIVHADVDRFLGDPMLQLQVRDGPGTRPVDLLLPVGADLPALHAFLRARLGDAPRAPARVAGGVPPADG